MLPKSPHLYLDVLLSIIHRWFKASRRLLADTDPSKRWVQLRCLSICRPALLVVVLRPVAKAQLGACLKCSKKWPAAKLRVRLTYSSITIDWNIEYREAHTSGGDGSGLVRNSFFSRGNFLETHHEYERRQMPQSSCQVFAFFSRHIYA